MAKGCYDSFYNWMDGTTLLRDVTKYSNNYLCVYTETDFV